MRPGVCRGRADCHHSLCGLGDFFKLQVRSGDVGSGVPQPVLIAAQHMSSSQPSSGRSGSSCRSRCDGPASQLVSNALPRGVPMVIVQETGGEGEQCRRGPAGVAVALTQLM
jgi:hypothetical protein